ncbi:MAG: TetR family transcriptional regulator [Polyangiaceae bacterium]
MATPQENRPLDMRQEILTAATRLFAERGYDATSLQTLADSVGIKKPSLLHHFESKDELRKAVLDDLLARWRETLPRLMLAATAGQGQFDAVTREIVDFFAEDTNRARLLIREALDRPEDMRRRLRRHVAPVVANLADTVRLGQERGQLRDAADAEAYLFQAIILLVCGSVFSESFSPLMPKNSERGAPLARLHQELLRLAKTGLFVAADAPGTLESAVGVSP